MTQKWPSPYRKPRMGLDSATEYIPTIMERQMWESSKSIRSTLLKETRSIAPRTLRSLIRFLKDKVGIRGSSTKQGLIKNS